MATQQTALDMGRTRAISETRDQFDDACEALRGFQLMLGAALAEYSAGGNFACGITSLLRQQIDSLKDLREDVFALIDDLAEAVESQAPEALLSEAIRREILAAAGRPAWHDLDTIAVRAKVPKADVARVMFILTGEDHEGAAYRARDGHLAQGLPAHLLFQHCSSALTHGEIWAQVSHDTGLTWEKVKEVMNAVISYLPKRERVSLEPFAEVRAIAKAEQEMRERVAQTNQADSTAGEIAALLCQADLARIAQDSGTSEDTVRKVLARLQADPGEGAAPVAVNG